MQEAQHMGNSVRSVQKIRWLSPALLCLTALTPVSAICCAQTQKQQSSFCEDDGLSDHLLKAKQLPKEVLNAVLNSEEGKQARMDASRSGTEFSPEKLLRGTIIRLSNDDARTYLLIGSDPLSGADNTWFWIVRESGGKAAVILWVGANCVDLEPASTHGYRDITADWASAGETLTESYRYDGKAYEIVRSVRQPRGPDD